MITIQDLTYRIEGRLLFDGAGVTVPEGHKVGLVGRNGSGKTTLFRILEGELAPESGTIEMPRRARLGSVAQEAPGDDNSILETVLAADRERAELLALAETAQSADEIAETQLRLIDIDAYTAPARAASILHGLGFPAGTHDTPCREFSGGWRMRVALAATLLSEPDILLLDEPTNYLDLEGTIWLETYIRRYPHTVLMVSHDRDLLNAAVGSILHLDQMRLKFYTGGYDRFERTRASSRRSNSSSSKSRTTPGGTCNRSSTGSDTKHPRRARRRAGSRRWSACGRSPRWWLRPCIRSRSLPRPRNWRRP